MMSAVIAAMMGAAMASVMMSAVRGTAVSVSSHIVIPPILNSICFLLDDFIIQKHPIKINTQIRKIGTLILHP